MGCLDSIPRYPPSFDLLVKLAIPSTNLSPLALPVLSSHSKLPDEGGVSSDRSDAVIECKPDSRCRRWDFLRAGTVGRLGVTSLSAGPTKQDICVLEMSTLGVWVCLKELTLLCLSVIVSFS